MAIITRRAVSNIICSVQQGLNVSGKDGVHDAYLSLILASPLAVPLTRVTSHQAPSTKYPSVHPNVATSFLTDHIGRTSAATV